MNNREEELKKIQESAKKVKYLYFTSIVALLIMAGSFIWSLLTIKKEGYMDYFIADMWGRISEDYRNMGFITKLLYLNLPDPVFKGVFLLRGFIEVVLMLVITVKTYGIFSKMTTTESPFDYHNIKTIRSILIIEIIMACLDNPIRGFSTGLLTWCLFKLFEYGCILQKESDDTV